MLLGDCCNYMDGKIMHVTYGIYTTLICILALLVFISRQLGDIIILLAESL